MCRYKGRLATPYHPCRSGYLPAIVFVPSHSSNEYGSALNNAPLPYPRQTVSNLFLPVPFIYPVVLNNAPLLPFSSVMLF